MAERSEHLGDFDGEVIEIVILKLSGGGRVEHRPGEKERICLVVTGTVSDKVQIARVDGRLVRIHSVKVDQVAEPYNQLADDAAKFLEAVTGELEGKSLLPFDEDDAKDETE